MKALVARALAKRVKDGDVLGLGSGTTVELAVDQIGQRIARENISVTVVPTSYRIAMTAEASGLQVLAPSLARELDWGFDGADEIDDNFNVIKGRGAAMLLEKIVARRVKEFVIIASEEKMVTRLGTRVPVPVEVVPEALHLVKKGLTALGARELVMRETSAKYGPVITEHGNIVLDAWFDHVEPKLEGEIKLITGVVESGLFCGYIHEILIAKADGVWSKRRKAGKVVEELIEKP
jgi:ribose 5-phosphate isomerase A